VWTQPNGDITIDSKHLNLNNLARASKGAWSGLPKGSVIGHVHLRVGNTNDSDAFYVEELGLERTAAMDQASFYGSGGYHHHLAGNIWNSKGSGVRPKDATGFYELELQATGKHYDFDEITDPWGMNIRITSQ
jgi:catechol 2,3-dioxygenase